MPLSNSSRRPLFRFAWWGYFMHCRTPNSHVGLRARAACTRISYWIILRGMDQCTQGLNFDTLRPRREILADYKHVLEKIYDPVAYARRLQRLARLLGKSNPNRQVRANDSRSKLGGLEVVHRVVSRLSGAQDIFRQTIIQCASTNPQWA